MKELLLEPTCQSSYRDNFGLNATNRFASDDLVASLSGFITITCIVVALLFSLDSGTYAETWTRIHESVIRRYDRS